MAMQEVEKALQDSGRKDIQTIQQNYSKWYNGADYGIHATYSPEPGVELEEQYIFAQREGTPAGTRTLVCIHFSADSGARDQIVTMLEAKYGILRKMSGDKPESGEGGIKNQKLFDRTQICWEEDDRNYFYSPQYIIQTKRTFGIFHILQSYRPYETYGENYGEEKYSLDETYDEERDSANHRIELTLIPAEDNAARPFMGFVKIGIKGIDVNLRDAPGIQGRVLGQVFGYVNSNKVFIKQPAGEEPRKLHALIAMAEPIKVGNSIWYKLFASAQDGDDRWFYRFDESSIFEGRTPYVNANFAELLPFSDEEKAYIESLGK
jgi:hypothetical protein